MKAFSDPATTSSPSVADGGGERALTAAGGGGERALKAAGGGEKALIIPVAVGGGERALARAIKAICGGGEVSRGGDG